MGERAVLDQIVLGASDPLCCPLLALGMHFEFGSSDNVRKEKMRKLLFGARKERFSHLF